MKYLTWRFLFFITSGFVLCISLIPYNASLPTTGWDKSNHLLAFGVLAYLGHKTFTQNALKLIIGLTAFGGLIEVLQTCTPTRSGDWQDLLADVLGIFAGLFLAKRI